MFLASQRLTVSRGFFRPVWVVYTPGYCHEALPRPCINYTRPGLGLFIPIGPCIMSFLTCRGPLWGISAAVPGPKRLLAPLQGWQQLFQAFLGRKISFLIYIQPLVGHVPLTTGCLTPVASSWRGLPSCATSGGGSAPVLRFPGGRATTPLSTNGV